MKRKWVLPVVGGSVLIGGLAGGRALLNPGRGSAPAAIPEPAAKPAVVEVVAPERRDLVRQVRLPGTVTPWEETQLYAKVGGYLQKIVVDKGDVVHRGQLLAALDVPELVDDAAQQRAQAAAARVRSHEPVISLSTARAEVERAEREVDAAKAAQVMAGAELEAARAAAREPETLLAAVKAETAVARAAAQEPGRDLETVQANLRAAREDLRAAEAEVERFQADYGLQDKSYQRYRRLRERDVVTQQELDQVEAAFGAARAALNTATTRAGAMRERAAAAQSAVRAARAKVTTAETRSLVPEAQVPNIEARAQTARVRVTAAEAAAARARLGVLTAETQARVAGARLNEVEAKIVTARADASSVAAGARKLQTLLRYRRLTAPYDGVVTARNVDPGQLIQASPSAQTKPLLVVSNIDRVRVAVPVSEVDVPHLRVGRAVTLTVRELAGKSWTGTVTRYTNDLDPQARTMIAEIDLPNPGRMLRPGMYADVVVNLETHAGALAVPSTAVVAEKQKRSLWVARSGKAQKIPVSVGVDTGVDAEITEGLSPQDQVITSGQASLKSDQPVRAVPTRNWSGGSAGKEGH